MPRTKIDLPASFPFSTSIPVRITDVNYGGHVGNDAVLSLIHEARMQFLKSYGYSEMNLAGIGLIMRDVTIEFKGELFYGDVVKASVVAMEFTAISFEIFYKLEITRADKTLLAAAARTGMVGYSYEKKKVVGIPEEVKVSLSVGSGQ